jgi:hypothetical protein
MFIPYDRSDFEVCSKTSRGLDVKTCATFKAMKASTSRLKGQQNIRMISKYCITIQIKS